MPQINNQITKINKSTTLEAAKREIARLKKEKAELESKLEGNKEQSRNKINIIHAAEEETINQGKYKIATRDIIMAELHE